MMEMEDKLRVLGDSSPRQTHLWESGDAIEFSNICLRSTTDATSVDPINHRNELLRTYNSPRSDASKYSCNSLLSSEHFIFKRTPRNLVRRPFIVVFKGWRSILRELFHSDRSEPNFHPPSGWASWTSALQSSALQKVVILWLFTLDGNKSSTATSHCERVKNICRAK